MKKPVIGITARIFFDKSEKDGNTISFERDNISSEYVEAVYAAGGIPVIVPVICDDDYINSQIERIDGLLIAGGVDINSLLYGEEPDIRQGFVVDEMDEFDIKCIRAAYKMKKPMLGICRGHQIINVAFGGTLYQDMSECSHSFVKHSQDGRRNLQSHTVDLVKGTKLYQMFGDTVVTNSYHHQALKEIAPGFKASGFAKDNVVEALEKDDELFVMSVQWHPEMMYPKYKNMLKIFESFIEASRK